MSESKRTLTEILKMCKAATQNELTISDGDGFVWAKTGQEPDDVALIGQFFFDTDAALFVASRTELFRLAELLNVVYAILIELGYHEGQLKPMRPKTAEMSLFLIAHALHEAGVLDG